MLGICGVVNSWILGIDGILGIYAKWEIGYLRNLENIQVTCRMVCLLGDSASAQTFLYYLLNYLVTLYLKLSYCPCFCHLYTSSQACQKISFPAHPHLLFCHHMQSFIQASSRGGWPDRGSSTILSSLTLWSDQLTVDHFSTPQQQPTYILTCIIHVIVPKSCKMWNLWNWEFWNCGNLLNVGNLWNSSAKCGCSIPGYRLLHSTIEP